MFLQALNDFYKRATRPDSEGETMILEAAFIKKYVRWIIPIKSDGSLEGNGLIENPELKKGGRSFVLPKTNRPKVAGGVAEFLWEGLEAVFGLQTDPGKIETTERRRLSQEKNRQAKFDDFWEQIKNAQSATDSSSANAVLRFREKYISDVPSEFLRWGSLKEGEKENWLIKTAAGSEEKLKADNFTFQIDGKLLIEDEKMRDVWRNVFENEKADSAADSEKGLCLVTGKTNVAVSASHLPKISGVPGTLAIGASLISFEKSSPAFSSYGWEKSYNAPISFSAVESYTNALNFLLSDQNHRQRIGETVLIFWANKTDTDFIADLFETPDEKTLKEFMKKPFVGDAYLPQFENDAFYSVILGGNAGRVVVRNWMQITVGEARANFRKWFEDLEIVQMRNHENDKLPPFNLFRLAASTVRETKDLRPEIPTELYRAALGGHAPSVVIIKNLVARIAIDMAKEGKSSLTKLSRFALLKLVVNRNEEDESKMIDPNLNEIEDYPYNCGRLLAVFEELQAAYHDYKLEGASVVEKYYGTAAATPNSAFGILWRLHQHHLKKVARSNRGKAEAIKQKIEQITKHFERRNPADVKSPPQLPRSFNLQEQGRFALGFYQQCAADRTARQEYKKQQKQQNEGENKNEK